MAITAAMVKELRERTGSGMMECKKALVASNGDIETAIEEMRKSGHAKAAKKASRIAAEGLIAIKFNEAGDQVSMVEVNCETDFVGKDENFTSFVDAVAAGVLKTDVADVAGLLEQPLHDGEETTINTAREALISKLGENMNVRRFQRASGAVLGSYRHGVRIGVIVALEGGDSALAKDIAMHVAATNPVCVSEDQVPADQVAKEKEIFVAQAAESGKPENIIEKMVSGKMRKYLAEITLLGQPFVKNPDQTVAELLSDSGAKVTSFTRFEVGEGMEKKSEDFAAEVRAQVAGV